MKLHDEATQETLRGKSGIVEIVDYRGRSVLAAYAPVSEHQWGVIVKRDIAELNAELFLIAFAFALVYGATALVLYYLVRRISAQIRGQIASFIQVATQILDGRYEERVYASSEDEFGALARSFNSMADSIVSQLRIEKISSDIIEVVVSTIDLHDFSRKVIKKIMEITSSDIAAFYTLSADGSEFKHLYSIGLESGHLESFHAGKLEGEFGKALATREIMRTSIKGEKVSLSLKTVLGPHGNHHHADCGEQHDRRGHIARVAFGVFRRNHQSIIAHPPGDEHRVFKYSGN
jgi:HAMP domain-containing protein